MRYWRNAPVSILEELLLQLRYRLQHLKCRVHVACVAQVLQTSRCGAFQLSSLRLIHVLQELDLLLGLLDDIRVVAGGCAHHHDCLPGLEPQLRHVGVILELAALDEDLLALGFDSSDGEELVLEGLAVGRGVHLDLVLLSLVLDDHCKHQR